MYRFVATLSNLVLVSIRRDLPSTRVNRFLPLHVFQRRFAHALFL